MSISDTALRLFLTDTLEPGPAEAIRRAVAHSPALQRRLDDLQSAGWPPALPRPDPWRVPPVGLGWSGAAVSPGTLGGGVHLGDVWRIHIEAPPDAHQREVVLLQRLADGPWTVVSPTTADERTPVDLLEVEAGRLCVDCLARPPVGPQRWALALPTCALVDATPLDPPDWSVLQAAVDAGEVPLAAVDIEVEP